FTFISESKGSKLYYASGYIEAEIEFSIRRKREKIVKQVMLADFIAVKGWKSLGNKLEDGKLSSVKALHFDGTIESPVEDILDEEESMAEESDSATLQSPATSISSTEGSSIKAERLKPGDSIEFDF
ncbi:MAG: hypothetical protein AAFU03_00250, partial [Bacteroidota bacterium]